MCARRCARCWARMADFVLHANLPVRAECVIIGAKYAHLLAQPLKKWGIKPLFVPDNPNIDVRLSGHADLSILHAGGEKLWLSPYLQESGLAARLAEYGAALHYADIAQSAEYPHDAQLNIAALDSVFIYNPKVSYAPAVEHLTGTQKMLSVAVRQGYARCSVLAVDERSIVTQDAGIARAAWNAGLDVLVISAGHVALDGFEYGFLGGAGFKLTADTMAFTGLLDMHPEKPRILAFLTERGINTVYLTDLPVFDIGSAIPITEKKLL